MTRFVKESGFCATITTVLRTITCFCLCFAQSADVTIAIQEKLRYIKTAAHRCSAWPHATGIIHWLHQIWNLNVKLIILMLLDVNICSFSRHTTPHTHRQFGFTYTTLLYDWKSNCLFSELPMSVSTATVHMKPLHFTNASNALMFTLHCVLKVLGKTLKCADFKRIYKSAYCYQQHKFQRMW